MRHNGGTGAAGIRPGADDDILTLTPDERVALAEARLRSRFGYDAGYQQGYEAGALERARRHFLGSTDSPDSVPEPIHCVPCRHCGQHVPSDGEPWMKCLACGRHPYRGGRRG